MTGSTGHWAPHDVSETLYSGRPQLEELRDPYGRNGDVFVKSDGSPREVPDVDGAQDKGGSKNRHTSFWRGWNVIEIIFRK